MVDRGGDDMKAAERGARDHCQRVPIHGLLCREGGLACGCCLLKQLKLG